MGKGGARRLQTPDTCLDHLYDLLGKLVRDQEHMNFYGYERLKKTQAVSGAEQGVASRSLENVFVLCISSSGKTCVCVQV